MTVWTPGESQTRSKQWQVFGGPPFPKFADSADGVLVVCDGIGYIDWIAGLGAVGLGYRQPAVDDAVLEQLTLGVTFPLPTTLEQTVSESLCRALQWPEQVRWVKTGSEATQAAVLIARRETKRRRVVSMGYHGWHQELQPSEQLVSVPMDEWDLLLSSITDTTAAVIFEPCRTKRLSITTLTDYLSTVKTICHDLGAIVIFDELLTGFRWATRGIRELTHVVPDLACYGKALGNGYAVACVVGSRRLMEHAEHVSSTFGGECIGLAAAQAVLSHYTTRPVIDTLWARGERLLATCPALTGWPVHPVFRTGIDTVSLVRHVAEHGHLLHPSGFNIMYEHTNEHVDALAKIINETKLRFVQDA